MKKMKRNFVSISLALALCGGISGMAFAQEAEATEAITEEAEVAEAITEEAEAAEEAPEPTKWSAPSVSIGTGTFSIGVQTVFNGFLVTTPTKTYDKDANKLVDAGDTTIIENDDEDYTGKISFSASYDNSDAPGVGYSFGVGGGIRRVNNFDGEFNGYFDSPWGKLWLLNKQLWLRAGGPEDPWTAWDDNWSYGNDPGGAVQLNINPIAITALKGLNVGVTLPVPKVETKFDYSFKNMIVGFKLAELIPYTTISAALKLRGGSYDALSTAADAAATAATKAAQKFSAAETAIQTAGSVSGATTWSDYASAKTAAASADKDLADAKKAAADDPSASNITNVMTKAGAAETAATTLKSKATALAQAHTYHWDNYTAAETAKAAADAAAKTAADAAAKAKPLSESMDLNVALDFNLSPIQVRAEMQLADLNKGEDDLKKVPISGDGDKRSVNFQLHPRLDISLSDLVKLGSFSLETFTVYAWIRNDPLYVSDDNTNTELSVEWAPSYKLFSDDTNSITASLLFGGYYNFWGGDPEKSKKALEDSYDYNQIGFTLRPGIEFKFGPNAGIRLRDQIKIMQTGVDPERGIYNQVQVKFWWGF
ncbi:MAG: hypothetical protein LBJ41_07960 [Treponema sp.]|jgi:hypothetical protein|nr:hypothetical protein [Treponema sp.]